MNFGTSMAAPHVTGVIALMLQAKPTLTPAQVADVLTKTARRDSHTGAIANNHFGAGKLDALRAVEAVQQTTRPRARR